MTWNLIITGRKAKFVGKDPKTGKLVALDDTSPQVMQYKTLRDALLEAPRLRGLLTLNPNAQVEFRPPTLGVKATGEKMGLAEWIDKAAAAEIPSVKSEHPDPEDPNAPVTVDELLAGEAKAMPAVAVQAHLPVEAIPHAENQVHTHDGHAE